MKTFPLFAAMLLLTACYQSSDEALVDETSKTVLFRVEAFGVQQDALTRGAMTPSKLLIIDTYNGKADTYTQESLAEVPIPLTYGQHNIYFVASSTAWNTVDKEALTVAWANTRGSMEYVWAKKLSLEVSSSTGAQEVVLPLISADVRVTTLDGMPTNLGDVGIEAPDLCHGLNLSDMTGYSLGVTTSYSIDCRSVANGTRTLTTNIYTLVPSSKSVGDITLTAYDATTTTTEIASHILNDVPVAPGYVSSYTGYFFSDGVAISFSYADQWNGVNDYDY